MTNLRYAEFCMSGEICLHQQLWRVKEQGKQWLYLNEFDDNYDTVVTITGFNEASRVTLKITILASKHLEKGGFF